MGEKKFDVRFAPDAVTEYNGLDNSVLEIVNKAIDELEYRADEIGKALRNDNSTKLAGCKEIKLREAGLRIIYRVTNDRIDVLRIVYILTIEERASDRVFKMAHKRLEDFKKLSADSKQKRYEKSPSWKDKGK